MFDSVFKVVRREKSFPPSTSRRSHFLKRVRQSFAPKKAQKKFYTFLPTFLCFCDRFIILAVN
ncbi:unnamed protein product [Meloidogyne enterolobii]|uniref:Uncharacterized protein n=1 Tax=Meloidogyne enterolobii TaxID=390850 RepID=A0ACB0Z8X0_MELEN